MFDSTVQIRVEKPFPRLGDKDILVRFPTDQEWTVRARARKFINRRLGRGRSEMQAPRPSEADVKLYEAIALNGTPTLSPGESQAILDFLGTANVLNVTVEDGRVLVDLETVAGKVTHSFKIPTTDDILEMRRAAFRMIDLPANNQEVRFSVEPGALLWDRCEGSSADYSGPVPAIHKDAAIRAAADYFDTRLTPKDDGNF